MDAKYEFVIKTVIKKEIYTAPFIHKYAKQVYEIQSYISLIVMLVKVSGYSIDDSFYTYFQLYLIKNKFNILNIVSSITSDFVGMANVVIGNAMNCYSDTIGKATVIYKLGCSVVKELEDNHLSNGKEAAKKIVKSIDARVSKDEFAKVLELMN